MAQLDGVDTARSAAIEALLPPTIRFVKSHGEGRPGGRLYSEAEFTDGQVRLTAVWDRIAVPVSSTAVRGSTRTAEPDGTVVEERDEPGTPELLMVAPDGDSVDVSVTGDSEHVFDSTRMRSLAERALAAG